MQSSGECMLSRECICMCVSVVCGGICIMRVIVYDETKDAMLDARWCSVPTDHVAADRQQQMAG